MRVGRRGEGADGLLEAAICSHFNFRGGVDAILNQRLALRTSLELTTPGLADALELKAESVCFEVGCGCMQRFLDLSGGNQGNINLQQICF